MFSLDDEASFQVVDVIRKEVEHYKDSKKELVIVVIGNKSDIEASKREVENVQVLNWAAREKVKYFEVNTHDRTTLFEPFVYLASKLNPPHNKSSFSQLTMGRAKQQRTSES